MKTFTIKEAFSFGWSAFKKYAWFLIILGIVLLVLNSLISYGSEKSFVISIIGWLLQAYLSIGVINVALKIYKDEPITVKDMVLDFDVFWRAILAGIIVCLIVMGGFILLIIPGIVWWLTYFFYSYIVVEKGMKPMDAIRASRKITKGERWNLFKFVLVVLLANLAGLLVLVVGVFVSMPVTVLAGTYVYKKLSAKLDDVQEIKQENSTQAA